MVSQLVPRHTKMATGEDSASKQLEQWQIHHQEGPCYITNDSGIDLVYKDASLTVGPYGPIVTADHDLFQQLGHFNRERIPERAVHAKGAGAFGYFEVTQDISKYTVAKVFEYKQKTNIAVRFSQVVSNLGTADTVRDPRGFAVKFYTEDGIWDLVGNNTPIFFMRDPILFPMFIHSQKRNPVTNLRDWNMFWDYLTLRPESVHQVMFLFSDRGIPNGHRHQHGFGSHTFSLISRSNEVTWCKFHYKTDQGIENITPKKARQLAGSDPDYAVRDLYNAIEDAKLPHKVPPSWTFYIQTMTQEEAQAELKRGFDPFDITKVWPHAIYPLQEVGKIVLTRNPINYFAEVEQLAFNPNNMPPGIGASPDRLLQGRMFAYQDAHNYRLGVNYELLPANHQEEKMVCNFQRDGKGTTFNQGGAPNYHPNSYGGPEINPNAKNWTPAYRIDPHHLVIEYYDIKVTDDNYTQPNIFWNNVLDEGEQYRLVNNLAESLKLTKNEIQWRAIDMFTKVDSELGRKLKHKLFPNMSSISVQI